MSKPNRKKFLAAKARMIVSLNRIIKVHQEIRDDIEWLNRGRADAPPFDVGGDISVIALGRKLLALVEAEQPIPDELARRFYDQVEANAAARD
jgi:hypothetical protein